MIKLKYIYFFIIFIFFTNLNADINHFQKGKNLFAGKTGTSQVRKITAEQRLRNLKNKDLPWKFRDHSLFVGYGPVEDPKFNITVVIDHGGSGSSKAAPIAKKIMSKIFNKYYDQKNA